MPFPRRDEVADRLRDRDRTMGFLIGIDPDDFTGHQRLVAPLLENGEFEAKAGIADPRHPGADVQLPVEQHRRLVFDQRLDDVEVEPGRFGIGILILAERAEIFGDAGVEIGQIMRVEHHALTVDFGIAHPERKEEPELLA